MSQYSISRAEDQATSPMEDSEQFAKMHPSFIAECRDEMSRGLAKLEVEDLVVAQIVQGTATTAQTGGCHLYPQSLSLSCLLAG